ncbi:TPA: hypothetical protein H1016_05595 [archaeon]|uniref:Archaeal Type IV pilin N-terminal domain-containing protein n=1 Tax=Candidatus Naiadarchaeum limnaeum TaxID=2756139 RepID=A0A832UT30_9ARCH|nr:hypothetical protein [Candidatus Naiadarchaeum limnaeum]
MVYFNDKGITPIIAVILLLMMTIAIGGLAYAWIQRLQTTTQSTVENVTTALSGTFKVLLRVEGYNTTCGGVSNWAIARIVYKNAGVEAAKNVRIYVDDGLRTESDVINGNTTLSPGVTTWAQLGNETCSNWINKTRKITIHSDESEAERLITFSCTTPLSTGGC